MKIILTPYHISSYQPFGFCTTFLPNETFNKKYHHFVCSDNKTKISSGFVYFSDLKTKHLFLKLYIL